MNSVRSVAITIIGFLLFTACSAAQELSSYRDFRFGASLESILSRTDLTIADAKPIHTRPALIQELEWRIRPSLDGSLQDDSVKAIVFNFYNGQLFRIAVNYNRERTEGLTDRDMIESISTKYGVAASPRTKTISSSLYQLYAKNEKVIACWEDAQYSFNLYRSSYERAFGMVAYSRRLDVLARTAVASAIRTDEQEAPGRLKQQAEESRFAQEKARVSNKSVFRP